MALERIEEELGLLTVLRDAVNFYLSYLQERRDERESAILELTDAATQVEQMDQKREQAKRELESLREKKGQIDSEFESIEPYVQLLSKIGDIKKEVTERQEKLREKENTLVVQERVALSKPDDEIVQDKLKRDRAIFRGAKASEDLVLQRLGEDLNWHSQRLGDAGVNVKEVEKQAQAVQGKLQRITTAIDDKAQNVTSMDRFIQSRQEQVDRLGELKEDLDKHEVDLANVAEVARLISEVPLNVQPVPVEPTS